MFYVYVVLGFAIFGAGILLLPGWWKVAWVGLGFVTMIFLPKILSLFLDPLNTKRIRTYCVEAGVTDIEVQPFPNHYGVHFKKNGRKHYAKCKVAGGKVEWKGPSPADIP
jgi:hypothetical protein